MESFTNLTEDMFTSRNYLLRSDPRPEDLLPGSDDNLGHDSVLQANIVFPWQTGFFPEKQDLSCGQTSFDMPRSGFDPSQLDTLVANTPSTSKQLSLVQDMFITGTTTLGFIYPQGIILATDSRATASDLIVSQKLNKVIPVSDSILCTLAGNAADCVYWLRSLAKECRNFESKYQTRMAVRHAANLLANMVRKYRCGNQSTKNQNGLSFGTLMASYDDQLGPQLYMLDNTGLLIDGPKFCVGSGAEYAQAILDTDYRPDLSEEEACALATSAIFFACRRDIHSGGIVRLYKINSEGWRQVFSRDVKDIYNEKEKKLGGGDR